MDTVTLSRGLWGFEKLRTTSFTIRCTLKCKCDLPLVMLCLTVQAAAELRGRVESDSSPLLLLLLQSEASPDILNYMKAELLEYSLLQPAGVFPTKMLPIKIYEP